MDENEKTLLLDRTYECPICDHKIKAKSVKTSVAKFVDKEYREQAKPANCYIEKNDTFVPAFSTMNVPKFKESYDSTESAYQLSSILKNNENVDLYGKTVIKNRTNI